MEKDKNTLLRLRVEDPYAILGICMYLNEKGYEVCGLHMFGKLNVIGMLRHAHLNHWIYNPRMEYGTCRKWRYKCRKI